MPDLSLEIAAGAPGLPVAGVDEVGRGPLAGPVMAAAVVLPAHGLPDGLAAAIADSKTLAAARRAVLAEAIGAHAAVALGEASVEEIDRHNILQATFLAMSRALTGLAAAPAVALIDGNRVPPGLACRAEAVIKGDGASLSIAAASIVAKVARDAEMARLAADFPGYGWERNAGYGTAEHRAALTRLGPCTHHRRSFAPVSEALAITR
ncbi:MAG: ribonuclease HII [Azospirillaceae bacterium]